jgi:hypothetical protein
MVGVEFNLFSKSLWVCVRGPEPWQHSRTPYLSVPVCPALWTDILTMSFVSTVIKFDENLILIKINQESH